MSILLTIKNLGPKLGILILTLIILGSALRFYHLSEQSYWMDEGYTVNAVISVVENGSTVLDSGQYYNCPTYCYPTAFLVKQLGDSPENYRLLATLAGIAFIGAIFFITRRLFTTNIALLTSFFITFSYWHIAWSRQARWYTLFVLFFWLALYFFYKLLYVDHNKWRNGLLTTIFTIATIFTHGLGFLLPLIFIIWAFIDKLFLKKDLSIKSLGWLALLGALVLLFAEYRIGVVSNLSLHYQLPYYLSFYLRSYWLFIALGLYGFFTLYQTYRKEYLFLFTVLLTYLIPLSFLTNVVHYRYLFHITPIFFIFGALGLMALYNEIKPLWARTLLLATVLALFTTVGGGVFLPQTHYYLESDNIETLGDRPHYAYTPQPEWNGAYAYIKAERGPEDLIISSHPHFNKIFLQEPGYWLAYNYLGFNDRTEYRTEDNREYYVGAEVIDDLTALRNIVADNHGYIVYDFMASDGRLGDDLLSYIESTFELVYTKETNNHSMIWVYRF
jgi:4-amino-4-deoxy-L-arabinose transferase-like glycosyltransferase